MNKGRTNGTHTIDRRTFTRREAQWPWSLVGLAAVSSWPPLALASQVTFEDIPLIGTPAPGLAIDSQYLSSEGMQFSLLDGGSPIIVQRGNPAGPYGAFASGYSTQQNVPAPGQGVGDFYLADPHIVNGTPPSPVIVEFSDPLLGASGMILDVDGLEVFTVTAYDSAGVELDSVTLTTTSPNAGDGFAAPWSITQTSANIAAVQIALVSYGPGNPGYALDNFVAFIPEPASALAMVVGSLVLLHRLR